MNASSYTQRFSAIIENFDSNRLGIYVSLFFHLSILLVAIGLPDFFKPKPIVLPNIIPIEIVNIAETTSIIQKEINNNNQPIEKKIIKQKKFNASENFEIKKLETQNNPNIKKKEKPTVVSKEGLAVLQKKEMLIKEKIIPKNVREENIDPIKNIESINTTEIKPKLKPKQKKTYSNDINTDVQIDTKPQSKLVTNNTDVQIDTKPQSTLVNNNADVQIDTKPQSTLVNNNADVYKNPKPQAKPKPDFSIASMLKDLRNEKSNNLSNNENIQELKEEISNSKIDINESKNMTLSISEYDLLRQQLSSCWNAPAGAVIEKGMTVKISTKVRQNRRVIENSVRIVDTNIAKSNSFYVPITESAMRTVLKPECTPLKLPEDKYSLWKNLIITFDYSIMKGYSE